MLQDFDESEEGICTEYVCRTFGALEGRTTYRR